MPHNQFLHHHPDFPALLRIVGQNQAIDPALVEKDYWIMHSLYGLQQLGMVFELKGGTSLSKGFGIIDRFSEDIDIRIEPPSNLNVKTRHNQDKPAHCVSRKHFYDYLAQTIAIDGIYQATRDEVFDDPKYRSGGIRLNYTNHNAGLSSLKDGILLEVGFDDVTPNHPKDISSWAYDYAADKVAIRDNRAKAVACYHPGYTLVEKLQTISTKFRQQQSNGTMPANFMRHYYDVYCLLEIPEVLSFIGTKAYNQHKIRRFRSADNINISENEAFKVSDVKTREIYKQSYFNTRSLYYRNQTEFDVILDSIQKMAARL